MMTKFNQSLLAVFIVFTCASAAPSEIKQQDPAAQATVAPTNLEASDSQNVKSEDTATVQGTRQKRFYNYNGYGFPPVNPILYPNFQNRDPYASYYDDPLAQIYRRVLDIATSIRASPGYNQPPPPPPNTFPVFFPVIFVPSYGCNCAPNQPRPDNRPSGNNTDEPGINNRWPDLEDERQNWGFVVNENDTDIDDGDNSRPISFVPIRPPNRPMQPPPPVEHGSTQAGADNNTNNQGSIPSQGNNRPVTTTIPPPPTNPTTFRPPLPSSEPPTACESAILSCCHRPEVTYDCFAIQGCPDPTEYGNPCDVQVILRAIDKFQMYYIQRNG